MPASYQYLGVHIAEQLKESLSEPAPNTKLYIAFGKTDPWANDAEPDEANTSIASMYEIWDNMIGGKRVVGSDVGHVIPRFNWEPNTAYTAYDHMNENIYATIFYVVTSQNAVYKCISNNNGSVSTVEPTTFNTTAPVSLSDGYSWKYMYTISGSELLKFTTQEYIPVKTLIADDGSQQWNVQNNARNGSIEHIEMVDFGSGYSNASNIIVSVTGDGSSFSAIANVSNGIVDRILVTNPGSDYTYADVAISGGGGTGAEARAIISPPGGHGSNPLYELGGRNIIINSKLRYDEEGVLPITNDYRQISLIIDPILNETNNVATIPAFSQMTVVTTSGAGTYDQDEYVYQGSSLETASFKGRVVWYDEASSKVYLINVRGDPVPARSLIGSESFTVRILTSVENEQLKRYSGLLLYSDNIKPVTRSSDQIEDYKIIIRL